MVSTSNRPPPDLYLNGLNRPLFLPFIPLLEERCAVHDIASEVDYRLQTDYAEDAFQVFYHPKDEKHKNFFDEKFMRWTRGQIEKNVELEVKGHKFLVRERGVNSGIAKFSFSDLCDKPLGAGDYITIGKTFHTVFIDDIPPLTLQERDQVLPPSRVIIKILLFSSLVDCLMMNVASGFFFIDSTKSRSAVSLL